jgi:hypothetical protein
MFMLPNMMDGIEQYIKPKQIVSITRIEPNLHGGESPEKVVWFEAPIDVEQFNESKLLDFHKRTVASITPNTITNGVFAPWAFYKEDYLAVGGNDWSCFAPTSREDDDIWNRFKQECDRIYEMIKAVMAENERKREENLSSKKELLAKALELSNIHSARIKEWLEHSTTANQLMEEWKKVGMVPIKYKESLWEEFRKS